MTIGAVVVSVTVEPGRVVKDVMMTGAGGGLEGVGAEDDVVGDGEGGGFLEEVGGLSLDCALCAVSIYRMQVKDV